MKFHIVSHLVLVAHTSHQSPTFVPELSFDLGTLSKKKNDIIWEFFPNVGPPPHPPLLGTPYPKVTTLSILE